MNEIYKYGFETNFESFPFGEISDFQSRKAFISETIHLRKTSLKNLTAVQYLSSVESNIPDDLISAQNFTEMKKLASHLTGGITSFFGFESRLNSSDAQADYLFAVSSKRGEREALAQVFTNESLPKEFRSMNQWQNVGKLAAAWADPSSVLYNKVLGLWFEFDTTIPSETPVPNIFIQVPSLRIDTLEDIQKCSWLTHIALPLLNGQPLSEKMEKRFLHALQQLPKGASVLHVASMLSRATNGLRLIISKINPEDIIPYLKSLGWTDNKNEFTTLIKEIECVASRIVLHINITEDGIDQKIGLECAYHPDQYNLETRWEAFFDYLIEKNTCIPEKKILLLDFLGVEQDDATQEFDLTSYQTAVRIQQQDFSAALVRYISHIKICYKPNHAIEAKVYPGVRLFGQTKTNTETSYQ
ncbi:Uncharacterised protein [uncultured archaeon]|nr:Uncharacterised protein [uncultured archaeon]